MHKITLKFLDQSIEQKYQIEHQCPKRKTHLKLFLLFFIVFQIIKLIIALIIKNYSAVYPTLGMMGCTAFSKCFNLNKEYHQRTLMIFINICFSIYVLFFDPHLDTPTMYFRGAHQMAINIINILGTEFIDSTVTIIMLYLLRIFHIVQNTSNLDITTIIMGLGANLAMVIMVYLYHKAIRSQFLLTKIDQRWENILKQILHNQQFILINYHMEKLQFQSISSTFSQTIQSQAEVLNFIRKAKVENDSLEKFLFHKLQDFSSNFLEIINHSLNVKFDKQLIQINYSIFFGNQPTILIQTSSSKLFSENSEIQKACHLYLKLMTVFIKIIKENKPFNKIQFHNLANKIQFQNLMISIWNKQIQSKTVSLKRSILKIQTFCNPSTKIQFIGSDQLIKTIPKIFYLLLASIVNCTINQQMIVKHEILQTQSNRIIFQGKFNIQKLNYSTTKIKYYLLLICKEIYADQFCINFCQQYFQGINLELNDEILQPFYDRIIPKNQIGYLKKKLTQ